MEVGGIEGSFVPAVDGVFRGGIEVSVAESCGGVLLSLLLLDIGGARGTGASSFLNRVPTLPRISAVRR